LEAGEIVCILGASGSGKTTLLRMLAGCETPDTGTISCDIKVPGPELGYLRQSDDLLPWRTITGNVALGPELTEKPKSAARAKALAQINQVGLSDYPNHFGHQISGGMKQRALLARTLVMRPKLLLMDEPMSNLDVLARRQLATLLRDYVHAEQTAALIVTHSVEEACYIADRILILSRQPAKTYQEISFSAADTISAREEKINTVSKALWSALDAKNAA
jgi:NitT/TauT family transport system ATP-binding protein